MILSPSGKLSAVYSDLRGRIERDEWKVGECLPRAGDLAHTYDCSVGMVSKAIAMLAHEGLVKQSTRVGTRVISNTLKPRPSSVDLDAFAFIYPSEKHEGIWRTVRGFQEAAQEKGRRIITLTTGTDFKKEAESIVRLAEFDVKAAAIYSTVESPEDQLLISKALVHSKFPVVLSCTGIPGLNLPSVFFDDFHAGYTMTRYLLQKGLKRIGFLSSSRTAISFRGYKWALEEASVTLDPALVDMEQHMHANYSDLTKEPEELAAIYLKRCHGLEAVVCGFDYFAAGLINAAKKLGIRIPDDLKVVGIDDFSLGTIMPLTTYHVPYEQIGRRSFQLLERIVGGQTPDLLEEHLKGKIVVRESA